MLYCLDDGNALLEGPASADGPVTAILFPSDPASEAGTLAQIHLTEQTAVLPSAISEIPRTAFDKRLLAVPLLIVIVGLAVYFGYRYLGSGQGRIESIAVMPFVNDSGNAEFEYLSDGMTEILISSLSQLPDMNVKPRSSVFQYKGKDTSSQTVANELNVQAILNGRVAQRGQNVSLFIELIDIASDKVVWSQQYSRNLSDLVELQSDVARDVSNKLKIKLSGADVAKVKKDAPANPEAYQLYLKARFQLNRRTAASIKQSVDLFKQAIESDPNYAPAHSGLARAYQSFASWSLAPPREVYPKVKASAQRALELDSESLAAV